MNWPAIVVTVLVGAVALGLLSSQFSYADDPGNQLSLQNLDNRVSLLESTGTNWIQRDKYCMGLSAYARSLDQVLQPGARVYLTDMLGATNAPKLGFYYFFKNYLFPREVAISLDGKATNGFGGFSGIPCDSPELLKSNGFDLMIDFSGNQPNLIPLTQKGVPLQ